jgi:hypothetical protein
MAVEEYVVTINVTVPVEELPFTGSDDELETLAKQVGQSVYSAIVQGDAAGRVVNWAKLPGGRRVAGRVRIGLEDAYHPKMLKPA